MQPNNQHIFELKTLAAWWRVLGLLAVQFARQILRIETSDPRGGLKKLEALETWLRAAVFMLTGQLGRIEGPHSDADTRHAQHLQAIAAALLMLILFVQRLKQRLRVHMAGITAQLRNQISLPPARLCSVLEPMSAYIDTS